MILIAFQFAARIVDTVSHAVIGALAGLIVWGVAVALWEQAREDRLP
jgi:hypothetical protein